MASDIFLTKEVATKLGQYLKGKQYSKICVLVDENTEKHCFPLLLKVLTTAHLIRIKSGEERKTLDTCQYIWSQMTELVLDRKALLINLGGGVISDMGGFCAATYKRGIDFIQIPTTLLAQVDASVGGKLGIDFHGFKNHIGVFQEPKAVLIDSIFLKTLPKDELRSGYAEVIKHCLIADKKKWEEISKKNFNELNWEDLCKHSIAIKTKITTADPLEKGPRKILNFGHTVGHAIESYYLNIPGKKLLHGEAIAIGMVCEAWLAKKKGYINQKDVDAVKKYIILIFGQKVMFDFDINKIIPLTLQDKKNENEVIQASLLEKVGKGNINVAVKLKDIREAIAFYSL
ncbi:MAG TPA: 3-dehydroquinate synthase [Cytophagaceae bacterium]|jgi:3-dehydroquinate synthase|nr:3-dehydroquinate synthase [Cytophagaceae bacterium]